MFRLHDKTRRHVCRAAFVLLCVVPTLLVLAWCVWVASPFSARWEANRIGRELGLRVTLGGIRHIRPGEVAYDDVVLSDPETGKELLACRSLSAKWRTFAEEQTADRPTLTLVAADPMIQADAIPRLHIALQGLMRRTDDSGTIDARLRANSLRIKAVGRDFTLSKVYAGIQTLNERCQAKADFRLDDFTSPHVTDDRRSPVSVSIIRDRNAATPAMAFYISTGDTMVPCRFLAMGIPLLGNLGEHSSFFGSIRVEPRSGMRAQADVAAPAGSGKFTDSWEGEIAGHFSQIRLGEVLTSPFPGNQLSGLASVSVRRAIIENGRLVGAEGTLQVRSSGGSVGLDLLNAAVAHLKLAPRPQRGIDIYENRHRYERLGFDFRLDQQGIAIIGNCPEASPGVVMADERGWLVKERPQHLPPIEFPAFLRTLGPLDGPKIPATDTAAWLQQHLPTPETPFAMDPEVATTFSSYFHPLISQGGGTPSVGAVRAAVAVEGESDAVMRTHYEAPAPASLPRPPAFRTPSTRGPTGATIPRPQ